MPDPDALRVDANATSPLPGNSSQAKGLDSSPAADGYSSAAAARRANGLPYTPAHGAGSYSSPRYIPQVPSFQSGNSPRAGTPNNKAPFDKGLNPYYQSRQPVSNADSETLGELEAIAEQATKSSGAIFKDPENVIVKPPLLSALITLEKTRSPYQLDADSASNVTLRDVLRTALESNLDIKIAGQDELAKKWAMVGAFSGFLPNITNEANVEGLGGQYVSPAGLVIPIHNPFFTTTSGFNWTLFKGGGILANYRQYKHSYKASAASAKGTINDVLDQVSNDFYNLVLNEVMLQIRVKQVQVTQALVLVDKDLFANGVNTQMDVLQAQYQLSQDRQLLIQQQVARREAAVKLATSINLNPEVDLSPRDPLVSKIVLVDSFLSPGDLMKLAIDNRQELKRYDELRLAAKEQLKVAKSTLFPVVAGMGQVIGSASRASSQANLLNGGLGLSSAGAGVGPASLSTLPVTGTTEGTRSGTMHSLFVMGVDVQWNFGGLGIQQVSQINSARADARRASLEFNRALAGVYKDVRDAYLSSASAENLIIETTDAVNYGTEELRVAEVRLKDGIGTSLDVINAERDYINALISKANAIVQYDMSQSKLLHAIGRVSVDTLTSNVPLRN